MSGRLEGVVALVVGGGSGMGRAGAVAMANEGASVVVADIDLERARRSWPTSCGGVAVGRRRLRHRERRAHGRRSTVERFGRLDAVYHCAVDVPFVNTQDRRLTELDEEVWARMIDLCLTGVFRVVKHAGRQMLKQQSGSIILSSTVDALVGCAGLDSYTAAKGGVTALVRSLAAGLAPDGIRVNAIAPSFVSTEPQKVWLEDEASRTTIEQLHLLADPDARGDRTARRLPRERGVAAHDGHRDPARLGLHGVQGALDVMGAMQANADG